MGFPSTGVMLLFLATPSSRLTEVLRRNAGARSCHQCKLVRSRCNGAFFSPGCCVAEVAGFLVAPLARRPYMRKRALSVLVRGITFAFRTGTSPRFTSASSYTALYNQKSTTARLPHSRLPSSILRDDAKMGFDDDVGIKSYLTNAPGFSAILKHRSVHNRPPPKLFRAVCHVVRVSQEQNISIVTCRFSDFVVREIAPDGSVARLSKPEPAAPAEAAPIASPAAEAQPQALPPPPGEPKQLVTAETKAAAVAALQAVAGPEVRTHCLSGTNVWRNAPGARCVRSPASITLTDAPTNATWHH